MCQVMTFAMYADASKDGIDAEQLEEAHALLEASRRWYTSIVEATSRKQRQGGKGVSSCLTPPAFEETCDKIQRLDPNKLFAGYSTWIV